MEASPSAVQLHPATAGHYVVYPRPVDSKINMSERKALGWLSSDQLQPPPYPQLKDPTIAVLDGKF